MYFHNLVGDNMAKAMFNGHLEMWGSMAIVTPVSKLGVGNLCFQLLLYIVRWWFPFMAHAHQWMPNLNCIKHLLMWT